MRIIFTAALIVAAAASARAQQNQVEAHGHFSRTIHTGQDSWGGGAQVQHDFPRIGAIQFDASLGGDWARQNGSGQTTTSLGLDVVVQPSGPSAITPFAGAGVSSNWMSGGGMPSSTQYGLDGIVGLQYSPKPGGPLSFGLQIRPGYVKTQEHAVTYRLGVAYSLK